MIAPDEPIHPWFEWLQHHGPRFLLYARQQTRTYQDAEDVLQEALLKLWQRRSPNSLPDPASMFATLRHTAIDLARKIDRRKKREAQTEICHQDSPSWFQSQPHLSEEDEELQRLLHTLDPKFQEIIVLKIWGELTFQQIGELLNLSPNTVSSRYRYGLESLRKKIHSTLSKL